MANPVPKGSKYDRVFIVPPEGLAALRVLPQVRFEPINEAHAEHLAVRIAQSFQRTPCDGRLVGSEIEIVAGRHRLEAVRRINADPVKYNLPADYKVGLSVKISSLSDDEAYNVAMSENVDQLPPTAMDLANSCAIWANRGMPVHEISARLTTPHRSVTPSRVSQLVSLMRLPREVQLMVHHGQLSEATARQILRQEETAEGIAALAAKVTSGELKSRDVTARANEARRAAGKCVKRTTAEVEAALESCENDGAADFLEWMRGGLAEFPAGVFRE